MATKKGGGTAENLTDSNPKYLGIKLYAGETAKPGSIIVRQRGTRVLAGKNTDLGKDHTIYALKGGKVSFGNKRHLNFDGTTQVKKIVHVK
jgi:large subunit ribosomal protein L27